MHNLSYGGKTGLLYRVVVRITEMMNMMGAGHSDIITAVFARALLNHRLYKMLSGFFETFGYAIAKTSAILIVQLLVQSYCGLTAADLVIFCHKSWYGATKGVLLFYAVGLLMQMSRGPVHVRLVCRSPTGASKVVVGKFMGSLGND